jgi:hypothetical protein
MKRISRKANIKSSEKSVVEQTAGSLRKYVSDPSLLGMPWSKIKKKIGEAIGEHAASEGLK